MSGSLAQAMPGCGCVAGRTDEIAGAPLRGDVWGCLRRFESLRRAAPSPAALSAGGQVFALCSSEAAGMLGGSGLEALFFAANSAQWRPGAGARVDIAVTLGALPRVGAAGGPDDPHPH